MFYCNYEFGESDQAEGSGSQAQLEDLGNFFQGMGLSSTQPLDVASAPGTPTCYVASGTKAIYFLFEHTDRGLKNLPDNVEHVENAELEQLIFYSTNQLVHGWDLGLWNNYKLVGQPRKNRMGYKSEPSILQYAFSNNQSVFVVKKAVLRDEFERVVYPFALSNLIGMAFRHNNITGATLRHLIFYNVTNIEAWRAMESAFWAAGVKLPLSKHRTHSQAAQSSPTRRRHITDKRRCAPQSSAGQEQRASRMHGVNTTIRLSDRAAWVALNTNNPFTKVIDRLKSENIENLQNVVAYTLIAVPQERQFEHERQNYWNTLIAHFEPPAPVHVETPRAGKGKAVEIGPTLATPADSGHHHQRSAW